MPNKTIYVSEQDAPLFDEAKDLAGEALSSVIVRALKEFVSRHKEKAKGMKDVKLMVGKYNAEREVHFIGAVMGEWKGFSDDKEWWMAATIYQTQKSNFAVYLTTVAKATLLTNRKAWKESGDYLLDPRDSELIIGSTLQEFDDRLPSELYQALKHLLEKNENPVEYLDI